MDEKIKERFLEALKESTMSYRQLEWRCGFSRTTICRYVHGDIGKMPLDKFYAICKALNVSPSYILGFEKEQSI